METVLKNQKIPVIKGACLRWATSGIALIVGTTFALKGNSLGWIVEGFNLANFSIFALMTGALGLALHRRNQVLNLQQELMQKQGQEIELTHRALNAHAIVCLTDPNGVITWVNDKFLEKYGYERADLVGRNVSCIYRDGAQDPVYNEVGRQLKKGWIWSGETEELKADGSTLVMHSTVVPLLDDNGRHIRTVAIRTDNTKFHRAEKARFLKELFDHLQDEVYIYDANTLQMVYANLNATASCGWDSADVAEKSILDANQHLGERAFRAHVNPLVNGEAEVVRAEIKRGDTAGEIMTRAHTGDQGRKLYISVIRDMTERVQTEKARMESVSVVSHELRTPLTSIKGSLQLLESGALGQFQDKAKAVLDIAVRNTDRLMLVVDDILDLEKIRAGKMELKSRPVDLVRFVKEAIAMNKGYAELHEVALEFESDLSCAVVNIDPDRMMQVLSNLISNAVKYSPEGGLVRLGIAKEGHCFRFNIRDEGPGIPQESHKLVFQGFAQIDSPDGKKRKGTGLGLTISQKIVHAMGGTIGFESEVGEGTCFHVQLPMCELCEICDPETLGAHCPKVA